MKFTVTSNVWTPWFAWHPVDMINGNEHIIVWWEQLERKMVHGEWDYRFPPEPPKPSAPASAPAPKEPEVTNVVSVDFGKSKAA